MTVFLLFGLASCASRTLMYPEVQTPPWGHLNRIPLSQAPDFSPVSVRAYDLNGSPLEAVRSLGRSVPAGIFGQQDTVRTLVFQDEARSTKGLPEPGSLWSNSVLRTRLLGKVIVRLRCSDPALRSRLREACMPYMSGSYMEFYDVEKEDPFSTEVHGQPEGDFLWVLGTNGAVVIQAEGDLRGSERMLSRAVKREFVKLEYVH